MVQLRNLVSWQLCGVPPSTESELSLSLLQSNRLTKIEGLQSLVNLRELYLSHNGIEAIEGLENNVRHPRVRLGGMGMRLRGRPLPGLL